MDRLNTLKLAEISDRLLRPLAVVGGLYLASQLQALGAWVWLHLLRHGDIKRYKDESGETWALVTGASAGIGKGFVQELAAQGFNVILHGRNETKLAEFQGDIQSQYPQQKFKLLVLDADEFEISKMETEINKIKSLNLRILVNNVAGGGKNEKPLFDSLQNRPPANIDSWTNITARFPTHITRFLLPTLIGKKSSLIINIGSSAGDMGMPYMGIYAGLKSYNKIWSCSLARELEVDGNSHVEVIAIVVGETSTERMAKDINFMVPSARQLAKSSLAATGSGKTEITAYWGHALQLALLSYIPTFLFDRLVMSISKRLQADERSGKTA